MRMKFLLFANKKIKVELRNTKALLTRQSCFPRFTLNTSVDIRMTEKTVKGKSAVFPGNPRGALFARSSDLVSTNNNNTSKT